MPGFYGADVEQLRALAKSLSQQSDKMMSLSTQLGQLLSQAPWEGRDAAAFRHTWRAEHAPMLQRVANELQNQAREVSRHADEQTQASSKTDADAGGAAGGGKTLLDGSGRVGANPPGDPVPLGPRRHDNVVPDDIRKDPRAGDPADIRQGQIGDCWLLAGIGSVAQVLNREGAVHEFLAEHLRPLGDPPTHWVVTLYQDGHPVEVTVEAKSTVGGVTGADGVPNWMSIYERAAAELRGGSYDDINGGYGDDALELMTGKSAARDGELDLQAIEDKLNHGQAVSVGSEGVKDEDFDWFWERAEVNRTDVVPNHAYIVTGVGTNGNGEKVVFLANPWGPAGGLVEGDSDPKSGTLELTENEYKENFDAVYSVEVK